MPSLFEQYAEKYADTFELERSSDGILEVRYISDKAGGSSAGWSRSNWGFEVWSQLWSDIGNDPDNELVIVTTTGDEWMNLDNHHLGPHVSREDPRHARVFAPRQASSVLAQYRNVLKSTENFVFGIDVPTIGAIKGPASLHFEVALLCDLTLCTTDTVLREPHAEWGLAPGDGLGLIFQELLGPKRAAYHLYTSTPLDASTALEYGLVNEVLPREELLPRCHEIARDILAMPRLGRLMTKQIVRRPIADMQLRDAGTHLAHELLGMVMDVPDGTALSDSQRKRAHDRWQAAVDKASEA